MKRKFPKQNSSGSHPQDEADSQGKPNVTNHRKDVAAYFLGGAAAITLTIASIRFSSNPAAAIVWFLVTGILGVTSGSFFWSAREKNAAIFWVWLCGCLLVSAGCIAWRWTEQQPDAPKLITKDSPAPPIPIQQVLPPASPTPKPSPASTGITNNRWNAYHFTPKQIMDRIKAEPVWKQEEIRKAFEGLSVNWVMVYFSGAQLRAPAPTGKLLVAFRSGNGEDDNVLVSFRVPLAGNEHFVLTERTQKFRVVGVIASIKDDTFIDLEEGATFEEIPESK